MKEKIDWKKILGGSVLIAFLIIIYYNLPLGGWIGEGSSPVRILLDFGVIIGLIAFFGWILKMNSNLKSTILSSGLIPIIIISIAEILSMITASAKGFSYTFDAISGALTFIVLFIISFLTLYLTSKKKGRK